SPVVPLRPNVMAGGGVDQLCSYTQTIACATDAPLHHVSYAQFPRHTLYVRELPLVGKGRSTSDDEQVSDPRKGCDDVFAKPIREVLLLSISTHIDERKHGDRGFRR